MPDRYRELSRNEKEGVDFRRRLGGQDSLVAIIAPHGGYIEPGTSEIAEAVAGQLYNFYCFEGLRKRPHGELHITSTRFDEPNCLAPVKRWT